jgi:putative photosynthetic complex assembly protein
LMVFGTRLGALPARPTAPEARAATQVRVVAARDLVFADRADGALVIREVASGRPAMILEPGAPTGFIRGVLRGLMRERKLHEASRYAPLTLTQWADGALTLRDSATGRVIELGSFGSSNRATFAELLVKAMEVPVVKAQAPWPGKDAA